MGLMTNFPGVSSHLICCTIDFCLELCPYTSESHGDNEDNGQKWPLTPPNPAPFLPAVTLRIDYFFVRKQIVLPFLINTISGF